MTEGAGGGGDERRYSILACIMLGSIMGLMDTLASLVRKRRQGGSRRMIQRNIRFGRSRVI